MNIGAHLSVSGGISKAAEEAGKLNINCLQIFSGSPRSWNNNIINQEEIEKFKSLTKKYNIDFVYIHSKYLINIGSNNPKVVQSSIDSLIYDLNLAKEINARGVIFHPHPHFNHETIIKSIKEILDKTPKGSLLILENSAQDKIKTIGKIIKNVKNDRVKFCLDTAHAFQSGYDLSKEKGIKQVLKDIETYIQLDKWEVVHANDSKTEFGSKHDVHALVGQGNIGKLPYLVLANHPFASHLPFILETPAFKENEIQKIEEIKNLKSFGGKKLDTDFFRQNTLKVAKQLLGKAIVVKNENKLMIGEINETEAYKGEEDKACHASKGKTKRTATMFGPAGKLYVYLIYGMYYCLNIVTEKKDYPSAVLLRGIKPIYGIKNMADGPGKLTKTLGINKKYNELDITTNNDIYLLDIGNKTKKIKKAKRIGVDYAGEWAEKKWRFIKN
jgi:apurinic endonuclease APN1/DNA-3-methyladenine glycosylase